MKPNEFYCVALKKRVTLDTDDICVVKLKNGRYALKGYCREVDYHLTKFISNDDVCKMQTKFGKCKKSKRRSPKKSKRRSRRSCGSVKKSKRSKRSKKSKKSKRCRDGAHRPKRDKSRSVYQ
jgi:hypothetical protein